MVTGDLVENLMKESAELKLELVQLKEQFNNKINNLSEKINITNTNTINTSENIKTDLEKYFLLFLEEFIKFKEIDIKEKDFTIPKEELYSKYLEYI